MRTPRLSLRVFALALIPLCLLPACGSSDEPTDGPSYGQTTAAPTRPIVLPTSTPRHSPPPTQTSPETDREALVALYNATGGPDWKRNDNWSSDAPISEWIGVTTDNNGRVTRLNLSENQLSGEILSELGNLASLTWMDLAGNQLIGCVPSRLSGRLAMHNSAPDNLQFCP